MYAFFLRDLIIMLRIEMAHFEAFMLFQSPHDNSTQWISMDLLTVGLRVKRKFMVSSDWKSLRCHQQVAKPLTWQQVKDWANPSRTELKISPFREMYTCQHFVAELYFAVRVHCSELPAIHYRLQFPWLYSLMSTAESSEQWMNH